LIAKCCNLQLAASYTHFGIRICSIRMCRVLAAYEIQNNSKIVNLSFFRKFSLIDEISQNIP